MFRSLPLCCIAIASAVGFFSASAQLYFDPNGATAGFWDTASTTQTWENGAGTQWNSDPAGLDGPPSTLSNWDNSSLPSTAHITNDLDNTNVFVNVVGSVSVGDLVLTPGNRPGSGQPGNIGLQGSGTLTFVGNPTLSTVDAGTGSVTISGSLGLVGDFQLNDTAGFTLSNTTAIDGNVTVLAGFLTSRADGAATDINTFITLEGGSVLLAGAGTGEVVNTTIGQLSGTSTTSVIESHNNGTGVQNLIIDQAADTSFAGGFGTRGANFNVEKDGTGSLSIDGDINLITANTDGSVTVTDGELALNGTVTVDSVTVNGGTLGGTGTIDTSNEVSNGVTINSGGALAPGNSPGQLTVADDVTFNDGSTFSVELLGGTTAGTDYDQLVMTGAGTTLSLTDDNDLELTLDASFGSTAVLNSLFFLGDLQDSGSSISGVFESINGVATTLTQGSTFTVSGYEFMIGYTGDADGDTFLGGNDLVLQYTAVPEPGTLLLVAGGLGLLFLLRHRLRLRKA